MRNNKNAVYAQFQYESFDKANFYKTAKKSD